MSQNSILELLSVTSNAVKALDKKMISKSSGSGRGTPREEENGAPPLSARSSHNSSRSSGDSGVGKTATHPISAEDKRDSDAEDSDHSTTASDVLIRSTNTDPDGKPVSRRSSTTSHGSRAREMDNFNIADVKNVKVSKKHLREIVSPRDFSDLDQPKKASTVANLNRNFSEHSVADLNRNNNNMPIRRGNFGDGIGKENKGKVINGISNRAVNDFVEKHSSGKATSFPQSKNMKDKLVKTSDTSSLAYSVERHHDMDSKMAGKTFPPKLDEEDEKTVTGCKPASDQASYQVTKHVDFLKEAGTKTFPPEPEDQQEDYEDGETAESESVTSSQPEIVTVPERVVNISSQALLSSEDDSASLSSAVEHVSQANKPQSFPQAKPPGLGLRQGAMMRGPAMSHSGKGEDVEISKFSLTEKQRELREALAKRGNQPKPVKRVVHARVVDSRSSSVSEELNKNNNMDMDGSGGGGNTTVNNVESITAAVAASAAVAATQPFLKLQQELESKMQTLLAEMDRIQKGAAGGAQGPKASYADTQHLQHLEQQVKELTERRLQHLEMLQSQQMEMQAHLLSMSRGMVQQQVPYPAYFSTSARPAAASSLGISRQQPYNKSFIEHQLARGRVLGEHSGVDLPKKGYQSEVGESNGSLLDTPNPRDKPPQPLESERSKGRGLLHEILAAEPSPQLNTTFSLPRGHTPPVKLGRSRRDDGGSPVEKARKLVRDLSTLEDQTAQSIWNERKMSRPRYPEDEPAPLELYLKRLRDPNTTPYSKLLKSKRSESKSSSTTTSRDAPVVDKFDDAHNVLRNVIAQRETLENNLELLTHVRQDVDVFALLGMAGTDSSEMGRIQKMVEKRISSLTDEVKREVEWDLKHNVTKGAQPSSSEVSRKATRGMAGKPGIGFGSGAPRMSRIDSRLRKTQTLSDALPSKGKKPVKSRPAPKSKIPYNDEKTMTQIYGKAQYQKGRSTVRDPYLHFQNQAKPQASRIPSPKHVDGVIDVKSSKTQTLGGAGGPMYQVGAGGQMYDAAAVSGTPRQFYFTPTTGYVAVGAPVPAPMAGTLVPMAVPLGKPRMDPGLAVGPETLPHTVPHSSSTPIRPVVTAASNVAMVAMTADEYGQVEHVPELGKQVLPAVDIDSITSASSCGSDIHIDQPDTSHNAGYAETFYYQEDRDEDDMDRTLSEYASDEEQQGTGFAIPGYHRSTPPREDIQPGSPKRASQNERFQSNKPQLREEGRVPWEERCDELAEDLRSRDILQNRAKYWLEQELMARMLMQMYPSFSAQAEQKPDEGDADKSESIPDDDSLIVGDTIGHVGLQLFVDAGQPVDNKLVNALVREVIAERVGGMLGRWREGDAASADRTAAARATTSGQGAAAADIETDPEFVRPSRQPDHIPTPQPTPRTSPVPGFVSQRAAPATPPLTPPLLSPRKEPVQEELQEEVVAPVPAAVTPVEVQPRQLVESDTEVSASLDISEELRALDEKLKPVQTFAAALSQPQHDIVTPTATPPPSPPPQPTERLRERTPTPSPPPQKSAAEPAQPAPTPMASPSPKKEQVQPKSPQPWGNPDSPGPELNPNYEEPEDLQHTQPKPLLVSKGVGLGPQAEERQSPSPQCQRTTSTEQSELDSTSSPSSASDTNNDNISEGQWLVSRSEGQVAGLPLDEGAHQMVMEAVRKVDVSTASTLRDTEDIELDETDVSRSEGEFRHKVSGDPEADPVLALLLQMQRQPGGFRQYDLPAERVQHVLNMTGRSVGELTQNGFQHQGSPTRKSMGEMSEGQVLPMDRVTVVTPKAVEQQQDTERQAYQQSQAAYDDRRRSSPSGYRASNKPRTRSPPVGSRTHQQQYQPVSSGLPPAKTLSWPPLKSALIKTSSEEVRHSRDSDPDSDKRDPPTEYGTRTLTPDQLSMDRLLQSGNYVNMSRSMGSSGRQGSTKKSVEFDLSGTYKMSRRDSWRGSDDYTAGSSDRLSNTSRSLGLRYSFEDSGSDRHAQSFDGSFLRMSVTIPTTEGLDVESDVSEIDLSENTGN